MYKFVEKIIKYLFPSNIYCVCCGNLIDERQKYAICNKCIQKIHWIDDKTCKKCGKIIPKKYPFSICKDCIKNKHFFNKGYTCTRYGLYERAIMMDYKYSEMPYIGRTLGKIMTERLKIENLEIDYLIPVPIHKERLKNRGYNQVWIMAEVISKELTIPSIKKGIIRKVNTTPMRRLDYGERLENVREVFDISEDISEKIKGKKLLIIDDIYTTGSTIDSLAKLLISKGAEEVNFLVFSSGKN